MEARLQRRVQRYGWDLAAASYEPLWHAQLESAQAEMIARAGLARGDRVLDVACGTGLAAFAAAAAVGPQGHVKGIDLSGEMVDVARNRALVDGVKNVSFVRMDAECLELPDASFDAALCALGLMYIPDPARAVREMRRVVRPGGRIALAVWGQRAHCGWASVFSIVDDEVTSEVCPLFFRLGEGDALARLCADEGLAAVESYRIRATLAYHDAGHACDAAFVGGPVALAWSRFDDDVRDRVCRRYVDSIETWRDEGGYRIPGEFVIVAATVPDPPAAPQ